MKPMRERLDALLRAFPQPMPGLPLHAASPAVAVEDWLHDLRSDGSRVVWITTTPSFLRVGKTDEVQADKLLFAWVRLLLASVAGHAVEAIVVGPDALLTCPPLDVATATTALVDLLAAWRDGMDEPLPFASKTAWAFVKGRKAGEVYDGSKQAAHPEGREFSLHRVYPGLRRARRPWPLRGLRDAPLRADRGLVVDGGGRAAGRGRAGRRPGSGRMSERLDALALPLWGSRLIEASAGTGKTWTIAALYLRLVLGHGDLLSAYGRPLTPPQILVMTFTKAATRELVERIRERLVQVARCFRGAPVEPRRPLPGRAARGPPDRRGAGPGRHGGSPRRPRAMDDAAVVTIDAWVQRMLREHAFDSGSLFDEELQPDDEAMRDEAIARLLASRGLPARTGRAGRGAGALAGRRCVRQGCAAAGPLRDAGSTTTIARVAASGGAHAGAGRI